MESVWAIALTAAYDIGCVFSTLDGRRRPRLTFDVGCPRSWGRISAVMLCHTFGVK
jgi:hypothetical protein